MLEKLKELQIFNKITFIDATHTYQIDGLPSADVSVTRLIGSYKEPFEKQKWAKIKANRIGVAPEEILKSWDDNNVYSTTLGTVLHNFIENYYQNKIIHHDKDVIENKLGTENYLRLREHLTVLIKQFYNFYSDRSHVMPVKNEFVLGDIEDSKICGMLDLLAYNTEEDTFEIYDFKTNKEIKFESKYKKYLLPPLDDLEDCEINTYSLQLNIYRYFIETYTSIKVEKLYIVWFNALNDNYQLIPLFDMRDRVEPLISHFLANKQA